MAAPSGLSSAGTSGDLLADRRFEYGRALALEGEHAGAADLFAQAVERAPDWAAGWHALGQARLRAGDRAGALYALGRAATLDPDDRLGASLLLAECDGAPVPAAAPPAFVRDLFDDYALRFDAHLTGALAYRGPALLRAALDRLRPSPHQFARALDLGCGTGLMGAAIRNRVGWLGGVDLSSAMIEAARAKGVYDALSVGEMTTALRTDAPFDLVLAADVLVYVGDLGPVFAAVRGALAPDGLFAFTVQAAPDPADVIVGPDRRFAHSPAHLRARAAEARLSIALLEPASTRQDAGRDVPGLVAALAHP